ncbi:hypothetical protein ACLOJK_005097 [Asimina triloba]
MPASSHLPHLRFPSIHRQTAIHSMQPSSPNISLPETHRLLHAVDGEIATIQPSVQPISSVFYIRSRAGVRPHQPASAHSSLARRQICLHQPFHHGQHDPPTTSADGLKPISTPATIQPDPPRAHEPFAVRASTSHQQAITPIMWATYLHLHPHDPCVAPFHASSPSSLNPSDP